jgi:hypothetical protein
MIKHIGGYAPCTIFRLIRSFKTKLIFIGLYHLVEKFRTNSVLPCSTMRWDDLFSVKVYKCQFHQHFTRGFFVRKFYAKLFCTCAKLFCTYILGLNFFLAKEYWRKCAHKMLVKLTIGCHLLVCKQTILSTTDVNKKTIWKYFVRFNTFSS